MSRKARRAHMQAGYAGPKPGDADYSLPRSERRTVTRRERPLPSIFQETFDEVAEADTPVTEVSDADCAFPSRWRELLPKWDDLTRDERHGRGPFCRAVSSIFFSGGKLSDHGITPKLGIPIAKVTRYMRATLGDFGPSHEHKIGGIAHMLAKWCVHHG